jgi:hypothetical protein
MLLIQSQAENRRLRLGEIRVRRGALARKELEKALAPQAATSGAHGAPTRPLSETFVERDRLAGGHLLTDFKMDRNH